MKQPSMGRARLGHVFRFGVIAVAVLLSACGDDSNTPAAPTSAPAPTVSPTLRPTETNTVRPTPTLTFSATPGLTITRTFTPTLTPPPPSTKTPTSSPTATVTPTITLSPKPTLTVTPTIAVIPPPTLQPSSTGLYVGVSKRDITPPGNVFLGGYGLGPGRRSTGVLAPIHVRAFVISDGQHTLAFAENETQGAFAAYKRGPYGLTETRKTVEVATAGAIPANHIVVGSCHSHAGPDTTGVWGFLPASYMNFLKDQTAGAILDAWQAMRPAQLLVGSVDATELLHSQFDTPPNDVVDGKLRVLVAADPSDATKVQTIMINFAAHATVMGGDNTLISSDWPGVVATKIEQALHVDTAVVMVADVGRTQPNRDGGATNPESLENYSNQVADKVLMAASALQPATGNQIGVTQLFLREPYANPNLDFAFLDGIIQRNDQPPWAENNSIGTLLSAMQVGDLFFAAIPGEGYPAILFELQQRVTAREHFIFGLANDQLGYLIAPQEGYPQVEAAYPANDNALFNVSPLIGDHVMCALFKASRQIGYTLPDDPAKCAPYATEDNSLPF